MLMLNRFYRSSKKPLVFVLQCPSVPNLRCPNRAFSSCILDSAGCADNLFGEMPSRDYKSCNALIKTYTAKSQFFEALTIFKWMRNTNLTPDRFAVAAVMKAAGVLSIDVLGESLHSFALKTRYTVFLVVEKALVHMYARFGAVDDSCLVFQDITTKDPVSWNVMLAGYARMQLYMVAMDMHHKMHASGVKITIVTIAIILPVCAKLKFLDYGQSLHAYILKMGMELETLVGNALISLYSKCGRVLDDAWIVFDMIPYKDVISWNSLIAGLSENGYISEALKLFYQMFQMDVMPNDATIVSILPICSLLENGWFYGKEIHGYALRSGFDKDVSVCNALMIHYLKVGDVTGAEYLFQKMKRRDLVTWNTLISGYAMNGWLSEAMIMFHNLFKSGMEPDSVTFISILPCCAQLLDLKEGKKIHSYILGHDFLSKNTSLRNALVNFYGKCGKLDEAFLCFEEIVEKDLVSWNSMLTVLADNGQWDELFKLLNLMNHEHVHPDSITVSTVLRACSSLGIMKVREVHGYSFRTGLISQPNVVIAILAAYANHGGKEYTSETFGSLENKSVEPDNAMVLDYLTHSSLKDAETTFNQMSKKDISAWNLMLQVYAQNNCIEKSFTLFRKLQNEGIKPDILSIMSILNSCSCLGFVHLVKQCHGYTIRCSLNDQHVAAVLLDSYSKCGSIKDACKQFQIIPSKDLITFTAMIQGYAIHGMADEAIKTFSQMLKLNLKPDHVILVALLSACNHAGLIDEGWKHFNSIKPVHGIQPTMEHYACMVDLLSRRGRLREAFDFIKEMPYDANANVWGSLLGSCMIHNEVEIGRAAADHLFGTEGWNIGNYVLMSNIYAANGKWDGVEHVRREMKTKVQRKPAGCSWIEVGRKNNVFVATDLYHPQRHLIYSLLINLDKHLKDPLVKMDSEYWRFLLGT